MKTIPASEIAQTTVDMEGAVNVKMRMLIGPDDNAPTFHMRQFEVAPGGNTPHHKHDFEHEVYIVKGKGKVKSELGDRSILEGDVVYVPPGEPHQFINDSDNPLTFLCLIPAPKDCCS